MAHIHVPSEVPVKYLKRSKSANMLVGLAIVVGLVSFVIRLTQDAQSAWVSYVTNWLFFMSLSAGGVLFTMATWITKSKWNWSIRRVGQASAAFMPIAFVLLLPMLTLREQYFPWIAEMANDPIVQKKAAYLNMPFLMSRNVVGLAILFGIGMYFVYLAVRPDMGLTADADDGDATRRSWRERLMQGWRGQEQEEVASYQRMTTLAPIYVLVYAVVMTIVAYDWIMSLEPHWYSTMLGPWFFMGAFWGGIAATAVWSLYLRTQDKEVSHHIGLQQRHDIGKLAFAFTVFWTYLFFGQYIVTWYGKLPWEQLWTIKRSAPPWGGFSALVVVLCFVVPFAGLMGRAAKLKPALLGTFTSVILVGLWLERYDMVAPSLYHDGDPIFTIWQPLIGLLFLGLWIGAIRWFLTTFPMLQIWQPMSDPETLEAELPHEVMHR